MPDQDFKPARLCLMQIALAANTDITELYGLDINGAVYKYDNVYSVWYPVNMTKEGGEYD